MLIRSTFCSIKRKLRLVIQLITASSLNACQSLITRQVFLENIIGKPIELSKDYDGKDKVLDLSVTFKNFKVTSNLVDGELYFDNTRVGTLENGEYEVSDYPLTDSAKAYVKKKFSDGDLKSQKQALASIADGGHSCFECR